MWTVASYVLKQKLKGRKRYPLVLMLEPLYRCNLACAGCGKIQYPGHILKQHLTPEECFRAVEECGVPTVAIPGGEPLMHPQIDEIVKGLVARKKYVYMCTNALLLKEKLHLFTPSKYLTFSVHMDGEKEHHDLSVCKEGGYELAIAAIREAVTRGFRVTTNTTIFDGRRCKSVRAFFAEMMNAGVEGMMISPGYSYDKAPDQQHFTGRERNIAMFRKILSNRDPRWQFNMSPLFLEFLMGKRHLECTPWGMPAYRIFGWQKPCYLLQDGYADTFGELVVRRIGRSTVTNRAIRSAPTACCIRDMRRRRWITRSHCAACSPRCARCFPRATATLKRGNRWRPRSRIKRSCRFRPRRPNRHCKAPNCGEGETGRRRGAGVRLSRRRDGAVEERG